MLKSPSSNPHVPFHSHPHLLPSERLPRPLFAFVTVFINLSGWSHPWKPFFYFIKGWQIPGYFPRILATGRGGWYFGLCWSASLRGSAFSCRNNRFSFVGSLFAAFVCNFTFSVNSKTSFSSFGGRVSSVSPGAATSLDPF